MTITKLRTVVMPIVLIMGLVLLACTGGGSSGTDASTSTTAVATTAVVATSTPHVAKSDTLLDLTGNTTLQDGSQGLVRFTGYYHTWSQSVSVPVSDQGALVALKLTITTGNDDLNGYTTDPFSSSGYADVVIHYATVGDKTYSDVNGGAKWDNGTTHSADLSPIPPSTSVGDIQKISIVTAFTGGVNGENWDVLGVKLEATFLP